MSDFFGGLLDVGAVVGELEEWFPRRVRIGKTGSTISPTGGQVAGAFAATPGLESIPAQRRDPRDDEATIGVGGADHKTVTHIWVLTGSWPQVKAGGILVELSSDGQPVGPRYEILYADVHALGIHTSLKTMKVTQ